MIKKTTTITNSMSMSIAISNSMSIAIAIANSMSIAISNSMSMSMSIAIAIIITNYEKIVTLLLIFPPGTAHHFNWLFYLILIVLAQIEAVILFI